MSKTYENVLQELQSTFKDTAEKWASTIEGFTKSPQTKAITLENWNTLLELLGRTDACVRATYALVMGLGNLGDRFISDADSKVLESANLAEDGTLTFTAKDGSEVEVDGKLVSSFDSIELPEKWYEINDKISEIAGTDGHPIMGGLVYKDMDGNTCVYPIAPAYGVRSEETGGIGLSAAVLYNSAQQILCKPATDGRHAVSLQQLDKFFGGTDSTSEKTYSIKRIQPVDTSVALNERVPYVFCRDTNNTFTGKPYAITVKARSLVERDNNGNITVNNPTSGRHPVTLDYLRNPAALSYYAASSNTCVVTSAGNTLPDTLHIPRFLNGYEIVAIGNRTFKQKTDLKEVIVSASVTEIGIATFYGCTSLKHVSFDERSKLTTLGDSVFEMCTALDSVEIPSGTLSIGKDAFNGCAKLSGVTIPASVNIIGKHAFLNCENLTLTFEGTVPPTIEQGTAAYVFNVKVPKGYLSNYQHVTALAECTFEEYDLPASYPRAEGVSF